MRTVEQANRRNTRERERYASDPEYRRKVRERGETWRRANREKANTAARRWYQANREREKERIRRRNQNKWHQGDADQIRMSLWEAQDRCCYLCREQIGLAQAYIDHDHQCCPRNRSAASAAGALLVIAATS